MHVVVGVLGVLQILGGILVYAVARSAIHEILGAVMFGMGVMSVGIALVVVELIDIRKSGKRQVEIFDRLGKPKAS
ncbi:hypothetical protein [Aminobacter sp. SS-2016]|uniref:hypothetical protein n=1 Tax=Aminobacter sp. Y103A TaxID=1870862 RepID=UPI002572F12C|nr:hypothetical protein [Aminobacter sp. SS-2016]